MCKVSELKRWLAQGSADELRFSADMLTQQDDVGYTLEAYPPTLESEGLSLRLRYKFAPGEKDDGVTVEVPIGVLPGISAERLEWHVPGFFSQLIEQWLRTLPKSKRRHLAPLPDKVAALAQHLGHPDRFGQGRLLVALAGLLADWYQLRVAEQDWDRSRIDSHLLLNIKILDETGN